MASGVLGMLAPSHTTLQPPATRILALSPSSSFWVAQGRAMSQGMVQMPAQPGVKVALARALAYSTIRARRTSFTSFIRSRSMPSGS